MRRTRPPEPVLITSAAENPDLEYEHRRRRYALMMAFRGVCVIAAACTYQVSLWLALAFVAGGTVLPWCAVIMANDGPARRRRPEPAPHRDLRTERGLTSGEDDRTVDG